MGEAEVRALASALMCPQASQLEPCCPSTCGILAWSASPLCLAGRESLHRIQTHFQGGGDFLTLSYCSIYSLDDYS